MPSRCACTIADNCSRAGYDRALPLGRPGPIAVARGIHQLIRLDRDGRKSGDQVTRCRSPLVTDLHRFLDFSVWVVMVPVRGLGV